MKGRGEKLIFYIYMKRLKRLEAAAYFAIIPIGAADVSMGIIAEAEFRLLGVGCRKFGRKSGEFSTRFALPFGGAYGGGGCPQEYEVDMLGRHIILSTYRRFLNF